MPSLIAALDQGTSSSRTLIVDAQGRVLASAQREFTQHYSQPGWVEHDPLDIWATQSATLTEALARAAAKLSDLAAIGITNQRETVVLWERATGRPLANAIVWQDRRTAGICAQLAADGHAPELQARTGLLPDAYFSATKLAWLLDHIPGARARAERGELAAGTIDSWLVWNLSGGVTHLTDVSNASRTLLCNLHTGDWDDELLALLRVPRAVLPAIVPNCGALAVARLGGLNIPITGMAGDQQAALFGQACLQPGMAKNTYGTGCFALQHTGTQAVRSQQRLLTTIAWKLGDDQPLHYALEGGVFIAGAAVQWLRDGLGLVHSAQEAQQLADSVPDSGGVLLVPAFTGLGAPHWDAQARGLLIGITRGTTAAQVARATIDSLAYQSAELFAAMQADVAAQGGPPLTELRVDGGAAVNDTLMQFQADLLGVPVVRPVQAESTALGAAYLAGLGAGLWPNAAALPALWQEQRRFTPQMSTDERKARMARWRRAVERARDWADD
ncbi:glycerol kinase [Thiomonas arsenitoxydans]|uniref:Glycerol kinase n=1 Tax=Thiomonas arsenitoxydans (strain DSM 22701 / CIP 110005 / 3As) TaxID=426114 RepID=D6CKI2_THIA3|nr:glycerol kinase GlpK [Thiomonas arsenitoxydans]CAZ87450.1 Glycerol kinase (ATP:glycerol 3-phosphotransferase) (Glycerokinase) (GK) [Thiomonas arsenitoxydans]CQR27292.1 glycerol kinase [Thiomonas arsenitoxydans]CQR29512.1 glycerol kinase [Thiomonas arsenitoxydans]CQR29529.1 glycerol kinase [Thiomonas arsenitoxydans]CQR32992.1 glycerol kinase [Thiomonas arsenitoxydans]